MRTAELDISVLKPSVKPANRLIEKPNEQKKDIIVDNKIVQIVEPRQTVDIKTKDIVQQAQVQANNQSAINSGIVPPNQTTVTILEKKDIKITQPTIQSTGKIAYWFKYTFIPFVKKPLFFIPAIVLTVVGMIYKFSKPKQKKYNANYRYRK